VAARYREDVEGAKTAREAAIAGGNPVGGGVGAIELWRGVKGAGRRARKSLLFRAVGGVKTSGASREAEAVEGAKNQYLR
jgi:hypothetical protein